jgi:hypothetical protein
MKDIIRIQEGQNTFPFHRLKKYFANAKQNSFSIIYGKGEEKKERSLDLIAPNNRNYKNWYNGLRCILKHLENIEHHVDVDRRFLKSKWDKIGTENKSYITKKDVFKVVASMNLGLSPSVINKIFNEVDRDKSLTLDFGEFCNFINMLRKR